MAGPAGAPAPLYLLGIGERVIAIALYVALSVLVWMAFSGRIGRWWILGAVLAHAERIIREPPCRIVRRLFVRLVNME